MLDLAKDLCFLPESVFMLGTRYDFLSPGVRESDRKRHLSLRNIVDVTPPVWLHLEGFHLGRRTVTNGQYLQFLSHATDGARSFDSADLWHHVWSGLNLGLEQALVPFESTPGQVTLYEEDYREAYSFVDAYLLSLRLEVQRTLQALDASGTVEASLSDSSSQIVVQEQDGTRRVLAPRDQIVRRLFAAVKVALRGSLGLEADAVLTDAEQRQFAGYQAPAQVLADVQSLLGDLRKAYRQRIDRRYEQAFLRGKFVIEPYQFLERFAAAYRRASDLQAAIGLHEVLYPRGWQAPQAPPRSSNFGRESVPWEEQPVFGLTLYEAAAYAAWLSQVSGLDVSLPNEAQYERASSWPCEAPLEEKGAVILDPALKDVFPWSNHNPKDFHAYFGREGEDLEHHYLVDRRKFEKLLEETSRRVDGRPGLYMLEGFGWCWTLDRYIENERKYQRFQEPDYPEFHDAQGRTFSERGAERRGTRIFDYRPNANRRHSHFVLKGSPAILGGPGLTIRRYAAYPLRAYPDVGFRILAREGGRG